MPNIALPDHLKRFACMQPWIGSHYRDERHKRLLVVGQSHYLPSDSVIHHDPERWYGSSQDHLTDREVTWASTGGKVTGTWHPAHRIYRKIQAEIARMLHTRGVTPDAFVLNHVAYCNYFLRPPQQGRNMQDSVCLRDLDVAKEVLTWFVRRYRPELVVVISRFAERYVDEILRKYDIPCAATPHPGSHWWNHMCASYGGVRGGDLFTGFLTRNQWVHTLEIETDPPPVAGAGRRV